MLFKKMLREVIRFRLDKFLWENKEVFVNVHKDFKEEWIDNIVKNISEQLNDDDIFWENMVLEAYKGGKT